MGNKRSVSKERMENIVRIYNSNEAAGAALGMAPSSVGRLCRDYGLETPSGRSKRERGIRRTA
jgi:hypothetical protein